MIARDPRAGGAGAADDPDRAGDGRGSGEPERSAAHRFVVSAPSDGWCLAVDIGGTKMAAGLVDRSGQVLWSAQRPTPAAGDAEQLFEVVVTLVDEARAAAARHGAVLAVCGIGCGGPMDAGTVVSPLNIPGWRSFPLRARVAEVTGLPTALDNDAKALALAEGWQGAARGARHYLAMVVSTGIGGGLVLDGRLLDGASGNAGHIGHVVVEPDGRPCACGGRGCLEAEASGSAIQAITGRPPAEADAPTRRRAGRLVGRGVASVVALLDLRLVLVAGSVALGYGTPFFEAAGDELRQRARIAHAAGAEIRPAGLGGLGPLVGAAAVGWRSIGVLDALDPLEAAAHPRARPSDGANVVGVGRTGA